MRHHDEASKARLRPPSLILFSLGLCDVTVFLGLILFCSACARDRVEGTEPSFFGHYELLSSGDREAILAVARPRIAALMPGAQIISVKVFRGGEEVYVTFARDLTGPQGGLSVEKIKSKWRITHENKPPR